MFESIFRKSKRYFDIFIVVAIVAAGYFIFRNFNSANITMIKDRLNVLYLISSFGGILIGILLRSWRWILLLRPIEKDLSFLNIVEIYASSQVVNYASPGKFGVPAKAVLLKKMESVSITRATPSLLSELFLDNVTMFFMLIGAAFWGGHISVVIDLFNRYVFGNLIALLIFVAGGVLLCGTLFIVLRRKIQNGLFITNLISAISDSIQQRKYFTLAFFQTLLILFLSFFCDWLIFRALGLNISYSFVVMVFSFSTIAGFLSPLPGGIGVREVSNVYLFKIFYNIGELALIVTILRRASDYLMCIILFGYAKVVKYLGKTFFNTSDFSVRNSDG